jgi:hypothetical protein
MLSRVETYNDLERHALRTLPNRIIEAAQCEVFNKVGYPTRVEHEDELWRYADAMQEGRAEAILNSLGGLTQWEAMWLYGLVKTVRELTNGKVTPTAAPLRALMCWRVVSRYKGPKRNMVEIGPGSGYCGTLADYDDIDYCATEVCQAFYLWQEKLLGDRIIPWWQWFTKTPPKTDIGVANHVLNEMHPMALMYFIYHAPPVVFVEDFGGAITCTSDQTFQLFLAKGYQGGKEGPVTVLWKDVPTPTFAPPEPITMTPNEVIKDIYGGSWPLSEDEQFLHRFGVKTL